MKAQEVHQHITVMNQKINDIIGNDINRVHFGGYIELCAAIASIEEFYDLSYAPKAEAKKPDIMNIMINAMLEKQSIEEVSQILQKKGLDEEDAHKVTLAESQRIKNLADWHQYYGAGYKFFMVECGEDSCDDCKEAYKHDKKYSIEDLDMIPPLNGEYRCNLMFYRK